MHAITPPRRGRSPWQAELAQAHARLDELLAALGLTAEACGVSTEAAAGFPLRVPRGFVARMRYGDPADPLLRQVLPVDAENTVLPGFGTDPVGDLDSVLAPGLLQKYAGRALLITTGACAVHCRYCFRREFPYEVQLSGDGRWSGALAAIAADADIEEVILSGGDPLALSNTRLGVLSGSLATIPQLRRLRVHTRMPIVLPSRVDDGFIAWLRSLPWPTVVVVHANHAQEIDAAVVAAFARMRAAGVQLLNQSVLLAGVNDDEETLVALSVALFDAGALPYYLHLLDPVRGAAHFEVPEARARELARAIAARLPGYLVPKLVREEMGAPGKTVL